MVPVIDCRVVQSALRNTSKKSSPSLPTGWTKTPLEHQWGENLGYVVTAFEKKTEHVMIHGNASSAYASTHARRLQVSPDAERTPGQWCRKGERGVTTQDQSKTARNDQSPSMERGSSTTTVWQAAFREHSIPGRIPGTKSETIETPGKEPRVPDSQEPDWN